MSTYASTRNSLEDQIVALLKNRDQKAVSLLIQHYAPALNGIILRIIRKEELAEEVLQDVLVKIWENAEKYDRAKGRLFTWMANIARNTAIDNVRSARYNREAKTGELNISVYNTDQWSTQLQTEDIGLKNVIASLDEKQVKVINLVYFQGYTHSEIAREYDIPLGTVKSRLRLAMIELRKKLGDDQLRGILLSILIFIMLIG